MLVLYFYCNINNRSKVLEFYNSLDKKLRVKVLAYIQMLINNNGKLDMPYSRKVAQKVWELRVDYDKKYYRMFYFIHDGKRIIMLHGFTKKSNKTPEKEIKIAVKRYKDYLFNFKDKLYEY
jgi:phage-related protein